MEQPLVSIKNDKTVQTKIATQVSPKHGQKYNKKRKRAASSLPSHNKNMITVRKTTTIGLNGVADFEDKFYALNDNGKNSHTNIVQTNTVSMKIKNNVNDKNNNKNNNDGECNTNEGLSYIVPATKKCVFCHTEDSINDSWLPNPLIVRTSKDTVYTQWVHFNCAAFSSQVYSNSSGTKWYNILRDVRRSRSLKCSICGLKGASMTCNNKRCRITVHITCAQTTAQNWRPEVMTDPSDSYDMWHCDTHYFELKKDTHITKDFSRGRESWPVELYDRSIEVNKLGDAEDLNIGKNPNITLEGIVYSQITTGYEYLGSFNYITQNIYGERVNPVQSIRHLKYCTCINCDESDFCECKYRRLYISPVENNNSDSNREDIIRKNN